MSGLLDGRVAIVTGGGAGIGRAVAEAFTREGAAVVVAEIDPARAAATVEGIRAAGGRAEAVVADVRRAGDVVRIRDTALDAFGEVHVLVNNVGHYLAPGRRFHETSEDDWQAQYETNLLHVFRMSKAVLPHLVERRRGSIVNVSTVEAFRGIPHQAVYGAFKAAVAHFTKCLALDVARDGVRVNGIAPDVTTTPQLPYDRWLDDADRARIPTWVPLGRLGEPADPAAVALFLASDLAGFVTGVTIPVDGGTLAAGGWYPTAHAARGWTNRPRDP